MADPTLYLFDGYNLLNAGNFGSAQELRDMLASFVAVRGARGVLVFDGTGGDERYGSLEVRYVPNADALLERLAAEHRLRERVCLVSSDIAVRGTSGQEVSKLSSQEFLQNFESAQTEGGPRAALEDRLDAETRAKLERLRRGQA